MRNYVNTDDELKLLYEWTGLAHLLSVELIQALLGCSWCRLPDPGAWSCWASAREQLWMGSTYSSQFPQSLNNEAHWQWVQKEQETTPQL